MKVYFGINDCIECNAVIISNNEISIVRDNAVYSKLVIDNYFDILCASERDIVADVTKGLLRYDYIDANCCTPAWRNHIVDTYSNAKFVMKRLRVSVLAEEINETHGDIEYTMSLCVTWVPTISAVVPTVSFDNSLLGGMDLNNPDKLYKIVDKPGDVITVSHDGFTLNPSYRTIDTEKRYIRSVITSPNADYSKITKHPDDREDFEFSYKIPDEKENWGITVCEM